MARKPSIRLLPHERRIARFVGKERYKNVVDNNRDPGRGSSADNDDPTNHILGAECEWAAAMLLNLSWRPTIGQIDQPDVGGIVEVRSTEIATGHLIIKPKDCAKSADRPFALMIRRDDLFTMVGWYVPANINPATYPLEARRGRDQGHWIPQDDLYSFDDLLNHIAKRVRK